MVSTCAELFLSIENGKFSELFPVGKIAKKRVWRSAFSALKIHCHIVKNTLLHTAFSTIFPLGYALDLKSQIFSNLFFYRLTNKKISLNVLRNEKPRNENAFEMFKKG